jgi:hypothetical protein
VNAVKDWDFFQPDRVIVIAPFNNYELLTRFINLSTEKFCSAQIIFSYRPISPWRLFPILIP